MKNNLKELRSYFGFSQEYVSKKANISLRYYQNIESCKSIPSLLVAHKIAKVFNKSIYDIFDLNNF